MNLPHPLLRILCPTLTALALTLGTPSCSDEPIGQSTTVCPPPEPPTPAERMDWWKEARFGLFIHYGVYSALAGEYIGPDIYGENEHFQSYGNQNTPDATRIGNGVGAEWIMSEALIPKANYRTYASGFTASRFNPQAIVELAQKAGMRYLILTSKHHEGFCLWDSPTTDWDIAATPAGKQWNNDLIAPLAQAARNEGMKFGLYFSEFRDWMHPGAPLPILQLTDSGGGGYNLSEQRQYMEQYAYPMIQELLERYAPDVIWWDGAYDNAEFAAHCDSLVRSYSATVLQNDRLSPATGFGGDFATPEQSMSEEGVAENSELCMTLNESWGYNQFDTNWKHPAYVLYSLLRAEKLGCNLLLNIGPEADGSIPIGSLHILEALAGWMDDNEKSAHGTTKSPFSYNLPYGPTTYRQLGGHPHLYYHTFLWDGSGTLWIPGVMNAAHEVKVSLPSAPASHLSVESHEGIGLRVSGLPHAAPDSLCNTLDIEFLDTPTLDEGIRFIGDTAYLDALAAKISNISIGDWEKHRPALLWFGGIPIKYKLVVPAEGDYAISAELAAYFNGTITFQFNDSTTLVGHNSATPGGHARFEWQDMGILHLLPGTYELTISSRQTNSWLRLRRFRLVRL